MRSVTHDIRVIPATSPEWAEWLAAVPHDFYHTAAYHRFSQDCGEGEACLAVFGDRAQFVAWPYLLRDVADSAGLPGSTFTDVTSVYGYPGPLVCNTVGDQTFFSRAWEALVELWRQQRVVTVFTRFHPLLANHEWLSSFGPPKPLPSGEHSDFPETGLVFSGQTVSIDLTLSDSENLRQYQKVLRQEIARSRRLGLVTAIDGNWKSFEDFLALYQCTMSRNHAASHYFFTADYFQRLRDALSPHVHLLVTKLDDKVAAAGIFVEYEGIVQAHLAGSSEELKSLSPLKVLLDDVRRWAQERGNKSFHMGGGRAGRDDSLWAFKAKFSPRWHPFYLGRWILEREAYVSLCEQRRAYFQEASATSPGEDFFPEYRRPIEKSSGAWSASNEA